MRAPGPNPAPANAAAATAAHRGSSNASIRASHPLRSSEASAAAASEVSLRANGSGRAMRVEVPQCLLLTACQRRHAWRWIGRRQLESSPRRTEDRRPPTLAARRRLPAFRYGSVSPSPLASPRCPLNARTSRGPACLADGPSFPIATADQRRTSASSSPSAVISAARLSAADGPRREIARAAAARKSLSVAPNAAVSSAAAESAAAPISPSVKADQTRKSGEPVRNAFLNSGTASLPNRAKAIDAPYRLFSSPSACIRCWMFGGSAARSVPATNNRTIDAAQSRPGRAIQRAKRFALARPPAGAEAVKALRRHRIPDRKMFSFNCRSPKVRQ